MLNVKTQNGQYQTQNIYTGKLNFMIYDDMTGRKKHIVDQNYSAFEKETPYTYQLITRSKSDSLNNPSIKEEDELRQLSLPLKRDCFIDCLEPIAPYVNDNRITKREIENILSVRNGNKSISKGISKVKSLWN